MKSGEANFPIVPFYNYPCAYFKKYGKHPAIIAFIDGVTAAAVGAIAGAGIIMGKRQFNDIISVAIAGVVILLLLKFKKIPEPFIIITAALAGLLLKWPS